MNPEDAAFIAKQDDLVDWLTTNCADWNLVDIELLMEETRERFRNCSTMVTNRETITGFSNPPVSALGEI